MEDCFVSEGYEEALAMTALNCKVEDCFGGLSHEGALAMTALSIDCHHEVHFKAVADEVIFLCEKWKIASQDYAAKEHSQ